MAEKKKVQKKDRRYRPVTAADDAAVKADAVAAEAAQFAEQEGVTAAAYVDYSKALENYESRSDVETLKHRRARSNGAEFVDEWHAVDGDGHPTDELNGVVQEGDLDAEFESTPDPKPVKKAAPTTDTK